MPADEETPDTASQSFAESFQAAARASAFGRLNPDEAPNGRAIIAAIGGVRGILESALPGIAFLVLFLLTHELLVSVLVPVALALVFLVARAGARSPLTSAIAGAVGLAITAALTLVTKSAVTNFVPGIIVNLVFLVVLLVTLVARRPLVGLIVGILIPDATGWRGDRARRRVLTGATWLWVGLFGIRLVLEVPLFYAGDVAALGVVRLISGVPLYALFLWLTWLLVRGAFGDGAAGARADDSDAN